MENQSIMSSKMVRGLVMVLVIEVMEVLSF